MKPLLKTTNYNFFIITLLICFSLSMKAQFIGLSNNSTTNLVRLSVERVDTADTEISEDTPKMDQPSKKFLNTISLVGVNFDSKNKMLATTTQFIGNRHKTVNYLFALGVKLAAEKDFTNLFSNGEISSSGGLSATFGLGNFAQNVNIPKNRKGKGLLNNYWFAYASLDPELINLKVIEDPALSFDKITIKDYHWKGRLGFNYYRKSILGGNFDILIGMAISYGQTDNITSLNKKSLVTSIIDNPYFIKPNTTDSTITDIKVVTTEEVLTGTYQEVEFSNFALDIFLNPMFFQTIGIYANYNRNSFYSNKVAFDKSHNVNLGLYFLTTGDSKKKEGSIYKPRFGLIFSWDDIGDNIKLVDEKSNFSFGIATNFNFGSYN